MHMAQKVFIADGVRSVKALPKKSDLITHVLEHHAKKVVGKVAGHQF
jgi:hypothetical protein